MPDHENLTIFVLFLWACLAKRQSGKEITLVGLPCLVLGVVSSDVNSQEQHFIHPNWLNKAQKLIYLRNKHPWHSYLLTFFSRVSSVPLLAMQNWFLESWYCLVSTFYVTVLGDSKSTFQILEISKYISNSTWLFEEAVLGKCLIDLGMAAFKQRITGEAYRSDSMKWKIARKGLQN